MTIDHQSYPRPHRLRTYSSCSGRTGGTSSVSRGGWKRAACPGRGVTSRALAGRPFRSDGTTRPTRIPDWIGNGAERQRENCTCGTSRMSHLNHTRYPAFAGVPHPPIREPPLSLQRPAAWRFWCRRQLFSARFNISCFTFSASWMSVKGLGRKETSCSSDSVLENSSAA